MITRENANALLSSTSFGKTWVFFIRPVMSGTTYSGIVISPHVHEKREGKERDVIVASDELWFDLGFVLREKEREKGGGFFIFSQVTVHPPIHPIPPRHFFKAMTGEGSKS